MLLTAVALDAVLPEPARRHPLAAFGRLAVWIEARLQRDRRAAGGLAWCLAVAPVALACVGIDQLLAAHIVWLDLVFRTAVLYLCLGAYSLQLHARPVVQALHADDLPAARQYVGALVSRDTDRLDATGVATAATESVLENGNDAVFGALFWFAIAGVPGVVVYRLANTLDAMWGYRTPRFARFGWAAARIDDLLNLIPAQLVVLTYALVSCTRHAVRCAWRQAGHWVSFNAGAVMAAGGGALGVRLGGGAPYHGAWRDRPPLGGDMPASADSITRALDLVARGTLLWLAVIALSTAALQGVSGA